MDADGSNRQMLTDDRYHAVTGMVPDVPRSFSPATGTGRYNVVAP